jgi:hypothetical protein
MASSDLRKNSPTRYRFTSFYPVLSIETESGQGEERQQKVKSEASSGGSPYKQNEG